MSQNDYNAGLPSWTVGEKYLNLVSLVAKQITTHGNSSSVVSKWSDTDLSVPLIFNFYHGLEIIMKGFLAAKIVQAGSVHKLSKLLEEVENHYPDEQVFELASGYINKSKLSSPLKEFFDENEITPDLFYQALKYADVKTKGTDIEISHFRLKYGGARMTDFYNQLAIDANEIRKLSVSLSRSLKAEPV